MDTVWENLLSFVLTMGGKLLAAAILLFVGHMLIKCINKHMKNSKIGSKMDITVKKFMDNFVKSALYCVLIISVIAVLGIPMASIVAVLGSAGLAVGLALQGALGNIAGGIMLILFKPFEVGDFVDAAGYSGTVDSIGLFYTVIKTSDRKRITVPNSNITGASVVNYSCEDNRRVDVTFTVAYGSDMEKTKNVMQEVIRNIPGALNEPAPFVKISKYLDSAVEITTRTWCKNADYWDVFYAITEKIGAALAENNIEVPFQQIDVHIRQ